MKPIRTILLFTAAAMLFLSVVWFTFKDANVAEFIQHISWQETVLNLVLCLSFFTSTGSVMQVGFRRHYNLKIQHKDVVLLPLMMHVFTYVMPIKGGMLFQTFFSRYKYKLDLSKGFSLGISVFLISLLITVVVGPALAFYLGLRSIILLSVLAIMGFGLLALPIMLRFFSERKERANGTVNRLIGFLMNVRTQILDYLRNLPLLFGLIGTTLVSVLIHTIWFWQTADMLNISTDFAPVLLIVLILRIILLVRFLPGNLGVQEIMIGVVFAAAGFSMEQGLLIALVTRLASVLLAATIGLSGLYINLHHFRSASFLDLIRAVASGK